MTDDTTDDFLRTSRHLSVWIDVAPETAYRFVEDPATWPRWAAGLAAGELRKTADGWVADSPMGPVTVEFSPSNAFGVLDHVVTLPTGEKVYNPMRVLPAGVDEQRCEFLFTVRRRREMNDDDFETDVSAVMSDLETLRDLLER
jgi:hypothetical protein